MIGKALSGYTGQGFFMIRPQGRDMADGRNAVTGVDVLFPPRRKFLEWAQRKQTASQSGKADQTQTHRQSNHNAFIHLAAPPFQQPQQAPGPYDQHRRSPCQGQKEQGLPCRRRGPQQQQIICGVGGPPGNHWTIRRSRMLAERQAPPRSTARRERRYHTR